MKRRVLLILCAIAFCASTFAAQITITATNLDVDDSFVSDVFSLLRIRANNDTYAVAFSLYPESADYTGTYSFGEQNEGYVQKRGEAVSRVSTGSITIALRSGEYIITGSVTCVNGNTYNLNLTYVKPTKSRVENIVANGTLEDRTMTDESWQLYAYTADNSKYILITAYNNILAGHYTTPMMEKAYTYVRVGEVMSGEYFDMIDADLTVSIAGNKAIISGTLLCQSEQNANDVPLYNITITCALKQYYSPLDGDATDADYNEVFPTYEQIKDEQPINGDIFVYAKNDNGAYIALDIYLADGETEITEGEYPINLSAAYQTVYANEGPMGGSVHPSYAGYLASDGVAMRAPLWYIMSGTVAVKSGGVIVVNALNSAGKTIYAVLGATYDALPQTSGQETLSTKRIENGRLVIYHNGNRYSATGTKLK